MPANVLQAGVRRLSECKPNVKDKENLLMLKYTEQARDYFRPRSGPL
jgi:hypothetical protein